MAAVVALSAVTLTAHDVGANGSGSVKADGPASTAQPDPQPKTAGPEPARTTREEVEAVEIAEGEIPAVASYYGISEEQARQRVRSEIASSGLDDRLSARWPDTYAGSWHQEDGAAGVVVAFKGPVQDPEQRRQEIGEDFAYPEAVEIRDGMTRSRAEVEDAYWRLARDIERVLRNEGHPRQELRETRGRFGVGLDIRGNGLTITLPRSTERGMQRGSGQSGGQRLRAAVIEHYAVPNVTLELTGEPERDCSRADCRYDMMGGLQLLWNDVLCTSGFTVIRSGERFVLSAGHCPGSWRRNGPDGHYGQVSDQQVADNIDAELIPHQTNPWLTHGVIALFEAGETYRVINSYTATTNYSTTWTVGMSGAASNAVNRGGITNTSWSGSLGGVSYYDLVRAAYCRTGGDSGAPVFRNDVAMGIHTGTPSGSPCDAVFTKIQPVLSRFNVSLLSGWQSPPPPPTTTTTTTTPPPTTTACLVRDPLTGQCLL